MKHLRKITEKFIHKWNNQNELIESIWGITESEIFECFSDIEDEFDVEMDCKFILKSKKGYEFVLDAHNAEIMEGYGAGGLTPIIKLHIDAVGGEDMRSVQSTMMDCIKNIDNYAMSDVSKSSTSILLELTQEGTFGEKEISVKSGYHKKGNAYFAPLLDEFKKAGYRIIINKIFEQNGKYYIKHPTGPVYKPGHPVKTATKKLYSIDIEKSYKTDLTMIDQLYEVKKSFESCINSISESKEFYDIGYDFEIEGIREPFCGSDGAKSLIRFSISAYELL